jgi:hypothetical protein
MPMLVQEEQSKQELRLRQMARDRAATFNQLMAAVLQTRMCIHVVI